MPEIATHPAAPIERTGDRPTPTQVVGVGAVVLLLATLGAALTTGVGAGSVLGWSAALALLTALLVAGRRATAAAAAGAAHDGGAGGGDLGTARPRAGDRTALVAAVVVAVDAGVRLAADGWSTFDGAWWPVVVFGLVASWAITSFVLGLAVAVVRVAASGLRRWSRSDHRRAS